MRQLVYWILIAWADTENTAEYPPELNMSSHCNWHPDVEHGGKILMAHDTYQNYLILLFEAFLSVHRCTRNFIYVCVLDTFSFCALYRAHINIPLAPACIKFNVL